MSVDDVFKYCGGVRLADHIIHSLCYLIPYSCPCWVFIIIHATAGKISVVPLRLLSQQAAGPREFSSCITSNDTFLTIRLCMAIPLSLSLVMSLHRCLRLRLSLQHPVPRRRQQFLVQPNINQRLHRHDILILQQIKQPPHIHKVYETRIQFFMCVDVIEWIDPVPVVQMCIASEHLSVEVASVHFEVFGKARGFASPVVT